MDKLILREDFPKTKLYYNKTSRRIPFLVKELSKATCWQIQPHSIEITNEMRKSVRAARTRYAVYLEEETKRMKV